MRTRRLGRLGHLSSALIYGAAGLAGVTQEEADRSIAHALDAGINHFDTAAGYGDSELRLAPWMPRVRDRIFLATKTGERTAEGAYRQINASLERLGVDLLQLHAVGTTTELDRITGPDGALGGALRARKEGLISAIGITGHGHAAPATHPEALRRFPFDTVLTPLNHLLVRDATYRNDYDRLVGHVRRHDVALMTIKTLARGPWPGEDHRYATWYRPFDDQEHVDAAVTWTLSHEEVTGLATAGDVRLVPMMIQAERTGMSADRAAELLAATGDYSTPFVGSWA